MKNFINAHKLISIIFGVILLLLLGSFAITAFCMQRSGNIISNLSIDGIDVGNMSKDEAITAISALDTFDNKKFSLFCGDETVVVDGATVALSVDVEKTVEEAYKIGRCENIFRNAVECIHTKLYGLNMNSYPSIDNEVLGKIIYDMGVRINGEAREAQIIDATETTVTLSPPSSGQSHDVSTELELVLEQLHSKNFDRIDLPLSAPTSNRMSVADVMALLPSEPKNAEFVREGNELYITDDAIGVKVEKSEIKSKIDDFNNGKEIVLNAVCSLPEFTKKDLQDKLFSAELSSYSSTYSTSAANRAFNVSKAASSINGKILLPGETFSYNSAIGNPSLANGYKVAPIFENGKTSEGVGGGVCQVSSTLYCATLYADLQIVERHNHSLIVNYVPKGQDATVSYGNLDFKFKNSTNYPIKINASASGGKCSVSIVGTKEGDKSVKINSSILSTTQPTVNETVDNNLPAGQRKVTSSGKTGYVVDTVKVVSENGETHSVHMGKSTYRMVPTEVSISGNAVSVSVSEPTESELESDPEPDFIEETAEEPEV